MGRPVKAVAALLRQSAALVPGFTFTMTSLRNYARHLQEPAQLVVSCRLFTREAQPNPCIFNDLILADVTEHETGAQRAFSATVCRKDTLCKVQLSVAAS